MPGTSSSTRRKPKEWVNGQFVHPAPKGDDRFVFEDKFGKDVITDFNARNRKEKIDLSDVTAITSMKDLRTNHMSQKDGDVVIKVGKNNRITLDDVDMGQLDASDFIF